MKNLKKLLLVILIAIACAGLTGCGEKNIEGSLEDIMEKVYAGIPDEERPMMLTNIELTKENIKDYIGTDDIEFEKALASESGVGSIAHSVVLIRTKEGTDIEKLKKEIKDNVNPRKWICVEAENVYIENKGDLVILIMSGDLADDIKTNFENLK